MANTYMYPVAQESYSKMKSKGNHYKKAGCNKLIEYANKLSLMIHTYLSISSLKITHILLWTKHLSTKSEVFMGKSQTEIYLTNL